MENRNDILNELREISSVLAKMEKANVYRMPAGYFENFAENMCLLVKEEQSSLLSGINKQTGAVPEGYFDTLAGNILTKIKTQQTETYPVLDKIGKQNVYTVPQGYFGKVSTEIAAKVNEPETKVVAIGKKSNWLKYAAAAAFTGVIVLSVYKFTAGTNVKIDDVTKQGIVIAKENRFEAEMAKIADDDIIKYLQKDGGDIEAALVANAIDEKELPSQDDYLLDEKALDNFLDDINVNDFKN